MSRPPALKNTDSTIIKYAPSNNLMSSQPSLLVAIPAYHESVRLPPFLESLAGTFEKKLPQAAILVVDDGSGPEEQQLLRNLLAMIRSRHASVLEPLFLPRNLGKGGAILAAWDHAADYDYLAFVDADGAVSPLETCHVAGMLNPAGQGPALFSSRVKMLGRTIRRTGKRHLTGRLFALLVGLLIDPEVYDSQCGLKFIPTPVYRRIRPWLRGHRFAFDVELLAALKTGGCQVLEVPINWSDIPGSKICLLRDTWRMFCAVIRIKREMKTWTL